MSWRTVVISKLSKVDYQMNYLVIREGINIKKVYINEIATVIFENTAVSLTSYVLCELIKNKIKVIFCDHTKDPISELIPYYGTNDCAQKLKQQIFWDENLKASVWTEIIKHKILNQHGLLKFYNKEKAYLLKEYLEEIQLNDPSHRESLAAKVYFHQLFGIDFKRSSDNALNVALNYGYHLILSQCNKEIVNSGYNTTLGLGHHNVYNNFNLASDIMEPLRPIIDCVVFQNNFKKFETAEKRILLKILQKNVILEGREYALTSAIRYYCQSIFNVLSSNGLIEDITWINYEF